MSSDNNESTLDRILLNRGGKKVVHTETKKDYRAKSFHSNRRSSFGRSSHNKNERSNVTVCRTSTDMNTNFDSMIARYQTNANGRINQNAANVNAE